MWHLNVPLSSWNIEPLCKKSPIISLYSPAASCISEQEQAADDKCADLALFRRNSGLSLACRFSSPLCLSGRTTDGCQCWPLSVSLLSQRRMSPSLVLRDEAGRSDSEILWRCWSKNHKKSASASSSSGTFGHFWGVVEILHEGYLPESVLPGVFHRKEQRGEVVSHQSSVFPNSGGWSPSLQNSSEYLNKLHHDSFSSSSSPHRRVDHFSQSINCSKNFKVGNLTLNSSFFRDLVGGALGDLNTYRNVTRAFFCC